MLTDAYDAVVVGLGAAGGIVADRLARAGMSVLGLDKGRHKQPEGTWLKFDELRFSTRCADSPRMTTDPITWRPHSRSRATLAPWTQGPSASPPLFYPPPVGVGGGSNAYSAWHWRQLREDFQMRSVIVERYGEQRLRGHPYLVDWPLSYEDLEPYYARVETLLGVSGQAGNIRGEIQPGGNPFEAPRSGGFPFPPLPGTGASELFNEAAQRLGYHPFPPPAAILSRAHEGRRACTYCGFCTDYTCHVGAKSSTLHTVIPKAVASGNLRIQAGTRVMRVDTGRDHRARAVTYVGPDRVERQVRAGIVVLAAYTLENIRLLLLSGMDAAGNVGKRYMIHNYNHFNMLLPNETHPYAGPGAAGPAIDDFNAHNVDHRDDDVMWGSVVILVGGDRQPIEGARNVPPGVPLHGPGFKDWLRNGYRRQATLYSQVGSLPTDETFVDLDPTVRDPWGIPAIRITHDWGPHERAAGRWINDIEAGMAREMGAEATWTAPLTPAYHVSAHDHGGHVMGDDPASSVVDSFGRAHEVGNLFVVGGGSFPTLSGYNPTATIQALALRAAEAILAARGGGGGEGDAI